MALLTKVGSLVAPGTATGSVSVTGLGFTPKVVIFFGVAIGEGTWFAQNAHPIGFATATEQAAVGYSSVETATTAAARAHEVNSCLVLRNGVNSAFWMRATFTSMDANGFTINFTNNEFGAKPVYYIALGGTELQAKIVTFNGPTTEPADVTVTGVGFKADVVMFMNGLANGAFPYSGAHAYQGFGVMNKQGQSRASGIFAQNGVTTSNVTRYSQADACMVVPEVNDVVLQQAHLKTMTADGFTLRYANAKYATAFPTTALCLKGLSSQIGSFQKVGTAAPVSQRVPLKMVPKVALFWGTQDVASGSRVPQPHLVYNIGASDGSNHRAINLYELDGGTPDTNSIGYPDRSLALGYRDGGVMQTGSVASTTFDGRDIVVTWHVNDTALIDEYFLVLGDEGQPTTPSLVAAL